MLDARVSNDSHESRGRGLWHECVRNCGGSIAGVAVPSYDMEIAFRSSTLTPQEPERLSVQAIAAPLKETAFDHKKRITRGGTWIVSGGGRRNYRGDCHDPREEI